MIQRRDGGRRGISNLLVVCLALVGALRVDSAQWVSLPGPVWTRYATQVGDVKRVLLTDGSAVDLNTDSEMRARLSATERQIELTKGEAFFTVARDTNRPFSVRAGGATIDALGTQFSVRLHEDDQVDVLVTQGKVVIHRKQEISPATVASDSDETPDFLLAAASSGESISLHAASVSSKHAVPPSVLARKNAWADGWLWFSKDPLPEAVAQFNRYHHEQIVLVDPALRHLEVGGRFQANDMGSFIAALKHSFGIRETSAPVQGTGASFIYLTKRCRSAEQQCN
jgi:transmembrane sensor